MNRGFSDSTGSADYRRQARRIRASFGGNSFLTQQAILALAKNRDRQTHPHNPVTIRPRRTAQARTKCLATTVAKASTSPLQQEISAVAERGFAVHAVSKLQPFGFTFSDRVALLATAESLGISRFRANLILAMQENKAPARSTGKPVAFSKSFFPSFFVVVTIEILIVIALVWAII